MDIKQLILAIIILIIIPFLGLLLFLRLRNRIKNERIIHPPTVAIFIIFITYGGLLLVVLTAFFLQWSGAASLGTFYLIFGAPIVMGYIAKKYYKHIKISTYHQLTYKLAIFYFVLVTLVFLMLYMSKAYLRC